MTMTPGQLREKAAQWDKAADKSIDWRRTEEQCRAAQLRAHAAALEEVERLKGERDVAVGMMNVALDQREQSERRAERLKWHAEAMATKYEAIRSSSVSRIDHAEAELYEAVEAYRAEFKEE